MHYINILYVSIAIFHPSIPIYIYPQLWFFHLLGLRQSCQSSLVEGTTVRTVVSVADVKKMWNIVPRVGIEPTCLAFRASLLPLHHIRSVVSPLSPRLPVYAAPCLRGQRRLLVVHYITWISRNMQVFSEGRAPRSLSPDTNRKAGNEVRCCREVSPLCALLGQALWVFKSKLSTKTRFE